jgi:hypothetical protein
MMQQINTNLLHSIAAYLFYITILIHTQFIELTNAAHEIEYAQALQCCKHDARIPVDCMKMCDVQQMMNMTSTYMWTGVGREFTQAGHPSTFGSTLIICIFLTITNQFTYF